MPEKSPPVEVHIQDDENSRAIMEKIRAENITDEAAIRALVSGYEFSSPRTRQHISDRMIDLLKLGVFKKEFAPIQTIRIDVDGLIKLMK